MKETRALIVVALGIAVGAVARGSDGDDASTSRPTDRETAFLKSMIPHHESAVDMAELAQDEGEHRAVRRLAARIVETQADEIAQMERIYERLAGEEIVPDPAAHDALGLSAREAGMHEEGTGRLEAVRRGFDRAFIDVMIPHHQGAIRMARVVLAETHDAEIKKLAKAIVAAQSDEIARMNDWRRRWYGRRSRAGGIPGLKDELSPSGGGGREHDSGH